VLVTGMLVHSDSMHAVISRAHRTGVRTVVGGPAASSRPDEFTDADHVFVGEAEGRLDALVAALELGRGPICSPRPAMRSPNVYGARAAFRPARSRALHLDERAGLARLPVPVRVLRHHRAVRAQSPGEVAGAGPVRARRAYRLGWRGSIFVVDDNFIGNRREAAKLLPEIARWQDAHHHPSSCTPRRASIWPRCPFWSSRW